MATRKDVAQRAGVSEATVSYVLNGTKPVTAAVEKRVRDAVQALGYRPNLVAKSLASRHTRHVAFLVENLQNPYYIDMLEGAQGVASEQGYIISTVTTADADMEAVSRLIGQGVEGAILTITDGRAERYMQQNVSCVLYGHAVHNNYTPAVYQMVDCLVGLGHTQIAFLTGAALGEGNLRYTGLRDALAAKRLALDPRLVVQTGRFDTSERAGYETARELLRRGVEFTAVFAINDTMAIGAARALWEAGLRIPGDVSLVGCDNIPLGEWLTPSLSTLEVGARQVGAEVMRAMIDVIEERPATQRVVDTKFLRRESVAERKAK